MNITDFEDFLSFCSDEEIDDILRKLTNNFVETENNAEKAALAILINRATKEQEDRFYWRMRF